MILFVMARRLQPADTPRHSHSATLRGLCAFGAVQVSNLLFEKEIASVAALPRNDSRNSDKIAS